MCADPVERLNIPHELCAYICPALLSSDLSFPQEASVREEDAMEEKRMISRDAFLRVYTRGAPIGFL